MIDLDHLDEYDREELAMCGCASCCELLASVSAEEVPRAASPPPPASAPPDFVPNPGGAGEGIGDVTGRGLAENVIGAAAWEVLRRILTRGF